MGRAPCCAKVGLKRGKWTAEEDELLTKYIQANGEGSWRSLPKNAGLLRCGKSCRLRWINYLRADLKRGNISAEEEDLIVKLHATFGNRWSLIASHLPGRTDNEIKNYWNSHLSRKIYSFRIATKMDTTLPGLTDTPKVATPPKPKFTDTPKVAIPPKPKPRGGRTSRWAMKKNKSYTQKGNQKPKQIAPQYNKEAVAPPPPPPPPSSLESEVNLCSTIEDFMVLDLDTNNNNMVEKEEGPHSNANKEKEEGLELGVQYCPMIEQENNGTLLGPYEYDDQVEGIINVGGGALSLFADMMDSFILEECGVLTSSEESDCNNNNNNNSIVGEENEPKKMTMSSEDQGDSNCVNSVSSNGESGDWYLGLDDCCWDWESLMELDDGSVDESEGCNWEQTENLLAWLWEDDDWERDCMKLVGEMDAEKLNDMLAWFLS